MREKSTRYDFTIPLYDVEITIYVSDKMSNNVDAINSDFKMSVENDKCEAKSVQFGNDRGTRFAMLFKEGSEIDKLIAHESLHISWYVCEYLGIKLSPNNHEAQAYLIEYIVSKANNFLI